MIWMWVRDCCMSAIAQCTQNQITEGFCSSSSEWERESEFENKKVSKHRNFSRHTVRVIFNRKTEMLTALCANVLMISGASNALLNLVARDNIQFFHSIVCLSLSHDTRAVKKNIKHRKHKISKEVRNRCTWVRRGIRLRKEILKVINGREKNIKLCSQFEFWDDEEILKYLLWNYSIFWVFILISTCYIV